MVICPLCEHRQAAGAECEVCGRSLGEVGAAATPVEALPDLESTRVDPVQVDAVLLAELEPTRFQAWMGAAVEAVDGLEDTRFADLPALAPDTVSGLERHRAEPIPGGGPDPLAPVTCRYCRTVALPGERLCGRCGMRLQTFEPSRPAVEIGEALCTDCGAPGPGPRCRRCGARMPSL
jgi:hypothetical protein